MQSILGVITACCAIFGLLVASGVSAPAATSAKNSELKNVRFDANASTRLSSDRRAQLDVEFFNEFWVKGDSGPDRPASVRAAKIQAMAEEGFEVAHLADQLFNFGQYGNPSFRPDYRRHWERLTQLAEARDPSAQCLFAHTAEEYRSFNQEPPSRYDEKVLAPQYRKSAAEQGHPHCLGLWVSETYRHDQMRASELMLSCARAGASLCQVSMAARYSSGLGLPRDRVKGLCWIVKARGRNSALSIENNFRNSKAMLWDQLGEEGLARLLRSLTSDTDCEKVSIQ